MAVAAALGKPGPGNSDVFLTTPVGVAIQVMTDVGVGPRMMAAIRSVSGVAVERHAKSAVSTGPLAEDILVEPAWETCG